MALQLFRIKAICLILCFIFINGCSFEPEKASTLPEPAIWLNRSAETKLPQFNQKPLVLAFLTYNCSACAEQLPILKEIYKKYENKIEFLGVFTHFPEDSLSTKEASRYIQAANIPFPVTYDKNGDIFSDYKIDGWPTIILIQNDEIKKRFYGVQSYNRLNSAIHRLE